MGVKKMCLQKNKWYPVKQYPTIDHPILSSGRVLVYAPVYDGKDGSMAYRMISTIMVRICSDIEMWMVPDGSVKN
jgi:hypothetical protein